MPRSLTPKAQDLNIGDCALESSKLFGSSKWELDLPPGANCNSHQRDKMNYSMSRPNSWIKIACIKEFLNSTKHVVAHTASILEVYALPLSGALLDCP